MPYLRACMRTGIQASARRARHKGFRSRAEAAERQRVSDLFPLSYRSLHSVPAFDKEGARACMREALHGSMHEVWPHRGSCSGDQEAPDGPLVRETVGVLGAVSPKSNFSAKPRFRNLGSLQRPIRYMPHGLTIPSAESSAQQSLGWRITR